MRYKKYDAISKLATHEAPFSMDPGEIARLRQEITEETGHLLTGTDDEADHLMRKR